MKIKSIKDKNKKEENRIEKEDLINQITILDNYLQEYTQNLEYKTLSELRHILHEKEEKKKQKDYEEQKNKFLDEPNIQLEER